MKFIITPTLSPQRPYVLGVHYGIGAFFKYRSLLGRVSMGHIKDMLNNQKVFLYTPGQAD